jgi:hypothetical protein
VLMDFRDARFVGAWFCCLCALRRSSSSQFKTDFFVLYFYGEASRSFIDLRKPIQKKE